LIIDSGKEKHRDEIKKESGFLPESRPIVNPEWSGNKGKREVNKGLKPYPGRF